MTTLWPIWTRLSILVPSPTARRPAARAVDRRVGADLDVVADDDVADLGHLVVAPGVERVAEAVAADDDAAVEDAPPADRALLADRDLGIDEAVVADDRARADVAPRHEHGAVADDRVGLDDAVGADRDSGADVRRRREHGAGVDAGLRPVEVGPEHPHRALERQVGVVDLDERDPAPARLARADHRRGAGLGQVWLVAGVREEGDVSGLRLADPGHPPDHRRAVAHQCAAELGGEFRQCARDHGAPS